MSVKHGLLALLSEGPKYGAQLRSEFEERTGGSWPLNVGQVYTTLGRLERDGLVEQIADPDESGTIAYRLTAVGYENVQQWWTTPVTRATNPRDELVIKCALAVAAMDVTIRDVLHVQRVATMRHLRQLNRRKRELLSEPVPDRAGLLMLEHQVLMTEAEITWLDHADTAAGSPPAGAPPQW